MESFAWTEARLSSATAPAAAASAYLLVVAILDRAKPHLDTRPVQAAHNLFLAAASAAMAVGTALEVARRVADEASPRWLFCESPTTTPTGALWFFSYVYYLSKYYELVDTVLQLLKGRPPPHFFLHVYHHVVVLFMAWGWLEYVQSLQFIGMFFNTSVHVVMYYYYFLRARGRDVWWKRYVTTFQIVQFMCSFGCLGVTLVLVATGSECAGVRSLALNSLFNLSLLYGFVGVLIKGRKRHE